jgi:hypothetical protein
MSAQFDGRDAISSQLETVRVRDLDSDGGLALNASGAPAPVATRIPVELNYTDPDGMRVHVLLHVVRGFVDELEIFREDSAPVRSRPTAGAVSIEVNPA